MNVSSATSSSDYALLMNSASTRHARRSGAATDSSSGDVNGTSDTSNPFEKALDSLESALNSGDTSTAQSVLSGILSHAPKAPPAGGQDDSSTSSSSTTDSTSSTSTNSGDQIGSLLNQIKSDLASGDTSSAESAVTSLKDYLSQNAPPPPPFAGAGIYSTDGNYSASSSSSRPALSSLA